jgi:hypothetical protein
MRDQSGLASKVQDNLLRLGKSCFQIRKNTKSRVLPQLVVEFVAHNSVALE